MASAIGEGIGEVSGFLAYAALTVGYTWGGAVEVAISPELLTWSCAARVEYTLAPLELTWSPDAGFGARSSVAVSQYAERPIYCWR
jgi:hypothetical protein